MGDLAQIDAELSRVAHQESALRLRLGQALEVLGRTEGFRALGFSSLSGYALERAERGGRWVEVSRALTRRLEPLPLLRAALESGVISWSMAQLLVRVAQPGDEAEWLALARGHTLRWMRCYLEQRGMVRSGEADNENEAKAEAAAIEAEMEEERCRLSITVNREDAWLFEATCSLLAALETKDAGEQIEALLAEAQETLLAALPSGALRVEELPPNSPAYERWREQLRQWRAEAERRCEQRLADAQQSTGPAAEVVERAPLDELSTRELDTVVREVAEALAQRELKLARLLLALHRAGGWRRLGYATERQYARERLGMSRSSLLARRALGLSLESLPAVASALHAGRLGMEAALLVARIACPGTEAAWLERAQQRTIKHLRQEVAAAQMAVRMSGQRDCPPPLPAELDAVQELERVVRSGGTGSKRALHVTEGSGAWPAMLKSLQSWIRNGVQLSAGTSAVAQAGRVSLRLLVSREVRAWWRALEAQCTRWLPRGVSWLRFACLCVWESWRHLLGVPVAYGRIYLRDRYQCSSPVCCREDVTPHHLTFRSAGGGEEDENLLSLCTWCHLFGVHGGTIRAQGRASSIEWELGAPEPCVRVRGRERLREMAKAA